MNKAASLPGGYIQHKGRRACRPREIAMELCLLHANCQGVPLGRLLTASPEFWARWRIRHYTNYTHEPVPRAELASCSLFLYQNLGPEWGELASATLLEGVSPRAVTVEVPNLFFKGYWPLWTSASTMNFGDVYLDFLTDHGLNAAETAHVCLKADLPALYDLEALTAESQQRERQRERGAVVELVDYVEEHWRTEQLFSTVNHPGPPLMIMVANAILARLEMPPLAPERTVGLELACDALCELPIHPGVGRHFGLPFVSEERRYHVYGHWLTYREYALCYADCRRKGFNFLEYLQAVQR